MPVPLTHLSCQQLDPAGPPAICAGLLGGELEVLGGDGSLLHTYRITEDFRRFKDILQGWFNAIHSLAVWHRGPDGRAWLVVGGYAVIVFLNADGRIVGHSFADGPWNTDILVAPEDRPNPGDLYVRVGWNHGIMQYKGFPGTGPSGAVYHLGGFGQPLFRDLHRMTSFVNGRSLAFAWASVASCPDGAIFAATELGCGIFSVRTAGWLWKLEGGTAFRAAVVGRVGDRPVVLIGGADGFVAALDLGTGEPVRRVHVGAPVAGLAQLPSGDLVVATRAGLQTLDGEWRVRGRFARPLLRLLPLDGGRVLIEREDHSIELIGWTGKMSP